MEISNEFKENSEKALEKGVLYAYCPHHLIIEGRNDLWVFPNNILFSRFRNESDGSRTMGSALYNPDRASLVQDKEKWSMTYRNGYSGDSYVIIHFDISGLSY